MIYDLSRIIIDLKNKNIENPYLLQDDEERKIWDVKTACISAILMPTPGGKESGDEKFKAYQLAAKITDCAAAVVDLGVDEAKRLKDAVGRCYGAVVIGFIWKILNGKGIDSQS